MSVALERALGCYCPIRPEAILLGAPRAWHPDPALGPTWFPVEEMVCIEGRENTLFSVWLPDLTQEPEAAKTLWAKRFRFHGELFYLSCTLWTARDTCACCATCCCGARGGTV